MRDLHFLLSLFILCLCASDGLKLSPYVDKISKSGSSNLSLKQSHVKTTLKSILAITTGLSLCNTFNPGPCLGTEITTRNFATSTVLFDADEGKRQPIPRAKLQLQRQDLKSILQEARKAEANGEFVAAKRLYNEIIEEEPDFFSSYYSLGNIYVLEGNLNEALLTLNKAISLLPPIDQLIPVLIMKGTVESNLQSFPTALQDLTIAEKLLKAPTSQTSLFRSSSPWGNPDYKLIQVNKAVIYSRTGQWQQSFDLFDQVLYNAADREVSPWIIRYVLSSLELSPISGPSNEITPPLQISKSATNFLERLLIRFPQEAEVNALATSIYTLLNDSKEAKEYWNKISVSDQEKYLNQRFLQNTVNWGPLARKGIEIFQRQLST